ncbi:MAG TPA: fibronectin type III domain-containing protein, partial [Bacteroidales bacterium]|nr:fibronectin type III domain-containing protein [Bacteroidales bacterium]
KVEGVTFAAGTFGTGGAANINITQGTDVTVCRNHFGTLTGVVAPTIPQDVVGFAITFNTTRQIAPRDGSDIFQHRYAPTIVTNPIPDVMLQNQILSSVILLEGSAAFNSIPVPGTFAWTTPSTVLTTAGAQTMSVTFTPNDLITYLPVIFNMPVNVMSSCYSDAPWIQGFEGSTSLPACWTTTATSTNYNVVTSGSSPSCSPHGGSNMLRYNSYSISSGNNAVLYTPLLNLNGAAINISYWQYRDPGYASYTNEGIEVLYNTTASTTGATSLGYTSRYFATAGWYNITYTIPAGLTGNAYIMFKATSQYGNNQFIDDININYLTSSCAIPTNLTVSNVGITTANVAWTPAGTETSWIVKYKGISENVWNVLTVSTPSTVLTNLNPSFIYQVSVKASCGASQYSSYVSSTFLTLCNPLVVLPYVEDFETVATNGFPDCFNKITSGSAYVKVVQMTGTKGIEMSTGGENMSMLILPSTQAPVNTLRLKFKYNGGANHKFKFGYITNINDATTFVTLKEDSLTINDWYYYDLFTSTTLTGTERMAIVFNMGSGYSARLDSVTLMSQPACYEPINLGVNAFTLTSATLNWAYPTTSLPTNYTVNYRLVGDTTWIVKANVTRPYNLTGLTKNNIYEFRVKANCTGSGSDWSSTFTFRTQYQVPYYQGFTSTTVPFAWTNVKTNGTSNPGVFDFVTSGTNPTCTPKAGTHMARYNAYSISNGGTAELSTPQILGLAEGSLIKFWVYRDDYSSYISKDEGIKVFVNDTASTLDGVELINVHRSTALSPVVNTPGWYQYIARVPSTGFNTVVFQGYSAYGNNTFFDEIEVTGPVYIPVTIVNGPNGTSNPTGTVSVLNGTNKVINFTPAVGYRVASITVNGNQVLGSDLTNSRPFVYTQAVGLDTLTINTTYEKIPYTITPSITNYHGANYLDNGNMPGTITPNTPVVVLHGDATTFTVNVNNHFHLYKLMVDGVSAPYVAQGNNTFTYTFTNVIANHTIEAIVKIDTIAIEYTVTGGAGILDDVFVNAPAVHSTWVNYGDDFMATMPAAPGYENISTTVNGQYVGAATQYQLFDIMSTQHISVVYAPKTITVATQTYGNGTITDGVTFTYTPTYVYNYTVVPTLGNYITEILVNEVPVTIANPLSFTGTLTNIVENTTIKAYFAPLTFGINATVGVGGTILPNGMSTYNYGVSQNYVINAETGYTIATVLVDNVPVTVPAGATTFSYNFSNITANHTIAVTFAINTYTLTATSDANGTVTPAGVTTINYNENQVYTITPATGYHILDVLVDGISMGPIGTYTFANVTANHTIAATFAINTYSITSAINGAGTITPTGVTTVNYGTNQVYTIAAASGSVLMDVIVDGISQGPVTTYTFTNVSADHNIQAITNTATFTVTVNQPANGAITPGTQVFNYGATPTFTITPNMGYSITAITVNSTPVTFTPNASGIATITLTPLAANATITATMAIKTYTITATAGANGTITPSGVATINYNTNSSAYIFTPNAGYEVADVTIDGFSLGAVSAFQFVNVTTNHTINVNFQLIPCEAPINTYVTNITQTNATLNWNNTGATSYTVQYKNVADPNYTLISNIATPNTELTGLTANTTYIWQVKANCTATNSSDWSVERSFVTSPVGPDGITDQDLASVQVYSNISNIFIVNKENVSIEKADIYDMYGKLIYTSQVTQNPTVITLDAATGIYVVRLSTENGTATYRVHITK